MATFVSGLATEGHNAREFMRQFWIERDAWNKKQTSIFMDPVARAFQYCRMIGLLVQKHRLPEAKELYGESCSERVWSLLKTCEEYHKIVQEQFSRILDAESPGAEESHDSCDEREQEYYSRHYQHEVLHMRTHTPTKTAKIDVSM